MDKTILEQTAKQLVQQGKGLLAADESSNSCQKRFDAVGVECTEETRRQYRQILITAPNINKYVSGVILYDETFWQQTDAKQTFRDYLSEHGILPGIKVDEGLIELPGFPNEKLTKGLDNLPERMQKYAQAGATFAKWRAVISISDTTPSAPCIDANCFVLARYARICQESNVVPIVEPEVLFDGTHTIDRCEEVMRHTLRRLFNFMRYYRVHLPGVILKTSMVLPGKESGTAIDNKAVATKTASLLRDEVPAGLGGVVFLSGGQTPKDAFINLNRIKQDGAFPWGVTFSYSRAIQDPVLKTWAQERDHKAASAIYVKQLKLVTQATKGQLDESTNLDNFVSRSQDL